MAGELDGISGNSYLAQMQSAQLAQLKNQKTEKSKQTGATTKARFSDILKTEEANNEFAAKGLPPEIQNMSLDEAAVYLRDQVDEAGNALSSSMTLENLANFKKAIKDFMNFVEINNFSKSNPRDVRLEMLRKKGKDYLPPTQSFSTYNTQPRKMNDKVLIQVINEKLDQITRDMLQTQTDNLKMLNSINELKGLVIDLLHG